MLPSFTWHQFLMSSLIFSLIWYAGMILFFYRNKWLDRFRRPQTLVRSGDALPHKWEKEVDELSPEQQLVGKIDQPEGLSTLSASEFRFADHEEDREIQRGIIPDVLKELGDIFEWLRLEDGSKKDFFRKWNELKAAFPKITQSGREQEIQTFISEHAPFFLGKEELESLWY